MEFTGGLQFYVKTKTMTTIAPAEVIQRRRFNIEQLEIQMASLDLLVEVAERRGADGAQAFTRAAAEFERIQHDYIDHLTDQERVLTGPEIDSMRGRLRLLDQRLTPARA